MSANPGIGGTVGAAPVARTACRNEMLSSPTVAVRPLVNTASPCRTVTPSASMAAGESIGAISWIALRTWSITLAKSTVTSPMSMPRRWAARAEAAASAAAIRAFEGTQPVHRQSPPVRSRSTRTTLAPNREAVLAATMPAVPPPTTRRS